MFIKTTFKDSKKVKRIKNNSPGWGRHAMGLHMPAHVKLKTHMGYIIHLEHGIVHFPICSWLINFYTIYDNDINTICHR